MNNILKIFSKLSKRANSSLIFSISLVGVISSIFSIIGFSLDSLISCIWIRGACVIGSLIVIFIVCYFLLGFLYKNSITLEIRKTSVEIMQGDIFKSPGFRIIGCDTHFDTRVDDIVISKKSLHGLLFLNHGRKDEIEIAVQERASKLGLSRNYEGLFDFPLGTIVKYVSSVDNQTYLLVALTEIRNENGLYKAYTSDQKFENMLRNMWKELDGVYASHDISIPLLGAGISRFEGGVKDYRTLLSCILCTLYSSGIVFNSKIRIIIYGDSKDFSLYEYKDVFREIPRKL